MVTKSAVVAASKLVGSAKKTKARQCARRMKLSLRKETTSKEIVNASLENDTSDLNETCEFQTAQPQTRFRTKRNLTDKFEEKSKRIKKSANNDVSKNKIRQKAGNSTACAESSVGLNAKTTNEKSIAEQKENIEVNNRKDESSGKRDDEKHHNDSRIRKKEMASSRAIPLTEQNNTDANTMKELNEESTSRQREGSESELSSSFHTCPMCGAMLRRGKLVRHMQSCVASHSQSGNVFLL